jgi:hypothetical protein
MNILEASDKYDAIRKGVGHQVIAAIGILLGPLQRVA